MSLSKGLNADESKMLRSLLQRAHENGSLNVFLPTLGSETSDWSEVESLEEDMSAAMNDASKRRLVSPDRLDAKHGQTKQLSSKAAPAAGTKSPTEENSVKIDFAKMKIPALPALADVQCQCQELAAVSGSLSLSSCHEVWWGFWAYWIQPGPQDRLIDLWMEPNLWKMWWMKQACYGDGKRTVPGTTIWKWYHANHPRRTCLSILDYDRCEIHRCLSTTLVTSHRLHVQGTFGWRIQKDEPERSHGWESWVSALLYIIYKYSHIYTYIYCYLYIAIYIYI